MPKYCSNCKSLVKEENKFCTQCGEALQPERKTTDKNLELMLKKI